MAKQIIYYSLNQVADQLGVSRNTIINWKSRPPEKNPIVFIKLGNHWKISHEDLKTWLEKEKEQSQN